MSWQPLAEPETQDKEFILTFGNTMVGEQIHAMAPSEIRDVSEPKYIHGFRHKEVLIDHRYPACVYEHLFLVITEAATIVGFMDEYFAYNWMYDLTNGSPTLPRTLTIENSDGDPLRDFGNCYFVSAKLHTPDEMLLHRVGFVEVRFVGAQKPVTL